MKTIDQLISWAKRRGFVFPSAEIYAGISGVYDFGPTGSQLKKNIRDFWWKTFVENRDDVVGLESAILTKKEIFDASGHLQSFTDPMIECRACQYRWRFDENKNNKCPKCGASELTEPNQFNLMFRTQVGEYLRPETAQGMFTDFKTVLDIGRKKLPFGIAQTGKSFRNELVSSGNFLFRLREFEIAEIECFVAPAKAEEYFEQWKKDWREFILALGIQEENLKEYEHPKTSLAHYSRKTIDWQYNFPFGWQELAGIANRTDFDLKNHQEKSGRDLTYFDEATKEKFIPYVIEPTVGIERLFFAILWDGFNVADGTDKRSKGEIVLKISPLLAPNKIAVLPLVNKDGMDTAARKIYADLKTKFAAEYDDKGSIGRRYRRQDEIGTPFCLTIDGETKIDRAVTVRDRDTLEQERVKISGLDEYLGQKIQ